MEFLPDDTQITPEQGSISVLNEEELFGRDPDYGKNHNIWAAKKVASEFIPFGKFLMESGKGEFEAKTGWGKAGYLGLSAADAALTIAGPKIFTLAGKGFRAMANSAGVTKFFKPKVLPLTGIDKIVASGRLAKFSDEGPMQILTRKYNLAPEEAQSVLEGNIIQYLKQGGIEPSNSLRQIIDHSAWATKKQGKLLKPVADMIKEANRPFEVRWLEHYRTQWQKLSRSVLGEASILPEMEERSLAFAAKRIFGEEVAHKLNFSNASADIYAEIAYRMLDAPTVGKLKKAASIGAGSIFPSRMQPVRFIFGSSDELFDTFKIYEKGSKGYAEANKYAFESIGKVNEMLAEEGLGKIKKTVFKDPSGISHTETKFTLTGKGIKDDWYRAGEALAERKDMIKNGAGNEELVAHHLAERRPVQQFMEVYERWSDQMLIEHTGAKLGRIVTNSKANAVAVSKFHILLEGEGGIIDSLRAGFLPGKGVSIFTKNKIYTEQMNRFRAFILDSKMSGAITKAEIELTDKAVDNIIGYMDDYVEVVKASHSIKNRATASTLSGGKAGEFYIAAAQRKSLKEMRPNLGYMIESRARVQSREHYFHPAFKPLIKQAKDLPGPLREYTGHWMFRLLGEPSPADVKMAGWLENNVGGIERFLGLKSGGLWNANRVNNLAKNINNMIYMGGLGFKPFSALRNFAQPFITVPSDLGGAGNNVWLVKGIHGASRKANREYIKGIGAIQEFAPEIHSKARVVRLGKRISVAGKDFDLPELQQVRDVGMWLFKMSDRWNRYVTGSAAIAKWDHYMGKFLDATTGKLDRSFFKKMNIEGRNKWIGPKIKQLVETGGDVNLQAAKKLFVNDVIADTQYLYGVADSPIISHTGGAVGKMAMVFQSWWMNYGVLLEKWVRTGSASGKSGRLFNAMLTAAVAEQVMEPVWGRSTAMRTVGMGPFPGEISEFAIPPAFAPFYHGLGAIINTGKGNPQAVERNLKSLLRAGTMFVPAGLQLSAMKRGIEDEGVKGLAKSLIRLKQDPDYEFMFGLFK